MPPKNVEELKNGRLYVEKPDGSYEMIADGIDAHTEISCPAYTELSIGTIDKSEYSFSLEVAFHYPFRLMLGLPVPNNYRRMHGLRPIRRYRRKEGK